MHCVVGNGRSSFTFGSSGSSAFRSMVSRCLTVRGQRYRSRQRSYRSFTKLEWREGLSGVQRGYVQRHATETRVLLGQVVLLSARQTTRPPPPIFGTRLFPLSLLRLAQQVLLRRVVGLAVIYVDTPAHAYLEVAFSAQPGSAARFFALLLRPPTCRNTSGPRSTSLHIAAPRRPYLPCSDLLSSASRSRAPCDAPMLRG
mgnify:CR=1 FL=1